MTSRPSVEQVAQTIYRTDYTSDDKWHDLRHAEQEFYRYVARAVLALFAASETVTTARERIRAALESWDGDALVTVRQADSLVDHLTAALVEPETVTTVAELDALPVGSVVLDMNGRAWQKEDLNQGVVVWAGTDGEDVTARALAKRGPFTVLHRGGDR